MTNRVLIIGAGLTGLALAAGLRHRGVEPVVVEQAPEIMEAGWAIGLTDRHLTALDRVGLVDRAGWPGVRPERHLLFDLRTGLLEHVNEAQLPLVFSRSELQLSFLQPVADLVRTGVRPAELVDLGDGVRVRFDDGSSATFDAVIGADGINSWTRRVALDGPEAGYTSCGVVRFHVPNVDSLRVAALGIGDGAALAYFVINGGKTLHGIVFLPGPPGNRAELGLAELADLFPGAPGPLASLCRLMRTDARAFYTNINEAVVERWTRNRVAVMGDAAHAMSPMLGQGAGVGFEDAALLADLLAMPDLPVPQALASYERIRKPAAQRVQRLARHTTEIVGSDPDNYFSTLLSSVDPKAVSV
ncbi:FAD-dependent oxidoreductase [Kutzneria sp. NPDC052558]|uniref:FAD-dependent oxidoreductase n=1 Tax=Kutzneria sp. NPDC052558 TaxID=3364121 RepID=UPI0037C93D4A